MFGDAGLVALPPEDWGKPVPSLRRDLRMRILRTPHNVVRERQPEYVSNWGPYRIGPNAMFAGIGDDALSALDRAGTRGAALLGAGAGFLLSSNRLLGALTGGVIGYFGGTYLTTLLKRVLEVQKTFVSQAGTK